MPHTPATPAAQTARARWALVSLFALLGLMMSSWLSRLPSIRLGLGLSEGELGVILVVGSVGSLLLVAAAGPLVERFGVSRIFHVSTVGFGLALSLLALGVQASSVPLVAAGIFLNGATWALNNVPLNLESAKIERAVGRTILPQFHAFFSVGALAGTGVGAACSALGVPAAAQLAVSAVVVVVWRILALPAVIARRDAPSASPGAARASRTGLAAWREPRTLLLGVVVLAASMSEGSANDWLSIAVVDDLGATEAVGAVVFGVFLGSMTAFRLAGAGLVDRWGRVVVLRGSALVSIVGLATFGLAPGLVVASVGVAMWGFGAALAYPLVIAAASDDPVRAAGRVSVVSAFASVASIAAPPLLGFVAEHLTTRTALMLVLVPLVAAVLVAGRARPLVPEPAPAPLVPSGTSDNEDDVSTLAPVPATAGTTDRKDPYP
ncbi:MFS transporter [Sanguibacter sp. HDW7]|uniref:MFS transporter n=1 Tax=Sanguibacter sp. HDW7 TaxID=2714931 RepID=UPI001407D39B|nr:MFS transporter [Sanguibacter sp. HDW7]QIK82690.1 MFS transporter [Sanguibacter sp. HDW7]